MKGVHARCFCKAERRIAGSIFTVVQRFPHVCHGVTVIQLWIEHRNKGNARSTIDRKTLVQSNIDEKVSNLSREMRKEKNGVNFQSTKHYIYYILATIIYNILLKLHFL